MIQHFKWTVTQNYLSRWTMNGMWVWCVHFKCVQSLKCILELSRCGFKSTTIKTVLKTFQTNQFSRFQRKASVTLWVQPTSTACSIHWESTRTFQHLTNVQSVLNNSRSKIGSWTLDDSVQWPKLECIALTCLFHRTMRIATSQKLEWECSPKFERRSKIVKLTVIDCYAVHR